MSVDGRVFKPTAAKRGAKATNEKTAEGLPGQDGPRHTDKRASPYTTRSHKSISRLPDSPPRLDSREDIYTALDAWPGQDHA
jgi:hypothetical protein